MRKKFATILLMGTIALVGCSSSPSTYMKSIKMIYETQGYDEAMDYYDLVSDNASIEERQEMLDFLKEKLLGGLGNDTFYSSSDSTTSYEEDYITKLTIEDHSIDGNKLYITVKNTGDKTISYFKYDIFFYDASGSVIDSDWSNSSKTILPDAKCEEDTYVEVPSTAEKYSIQIVEVNTK